MQYTVGDYVHTEQSMPSDAYEVQAQQRRGDVGGLGFGKGSINFRAKRIGWAFQKTGRVVPLTNAAEVYRSEATSLATRVTDAKVRIMNNYVQPMLGGGIGGSNARADSYVPPTTASLYKFRYSKEGGGWGRVAHYIARD
jgi:hypothetical protein